jgi:hypothetical protein
MQVDEKSICRLDKLPYVWGAIFGYTERKKYDRMNKHLHTMKKVLYMLAAAAVMGATSCGGKEDAEETVDTIKRKLVGTWVNPAFSFLPGEAPQHIHHHHVRYDNVAKI